MDREGVFERLSPLVQEWDLSFWDGRLCKPPKAGRGMGAAMYGIYEILQWLNYYAGIY